MAMWQASGKQRYRVDTDVVYWETHGDVTADEVNEITDVIVSLQRQRGRAYVICDSTRPSNFTPEARHAMRARYESGTAVPAPSVVVGGGTMQRVLLPLVLRAIRLLGAKPPPVDFVASMADAEAWLQRQRQAHAGSQGPTADL